MELKKFSAHQLNVWLDFYGEEFCFQGVTENEYHERVPGDVKTIRGIYHEQNGYQSQMVAEGSITHTFPTPMILCTPADAAKIEIHDRSEHQGKYFVVVAKNDVHNLHVAVDVSLREVESWQTDSISTQMHY